MCLYGRDIYAVCVPNDKEYSSLEVSSRRIIGRPFAAFLLIAVNVARMFDCATVLFPLLSALIIYKNILQEE